MNRKEIAQQLERSGDPKLAVSLLERFEGSYQRSEAGPFSWDSEAAERLLLLFGNSPLLCEKLIAHPSWGTRFIASSDWKRRHSKKELIDELQSTLRKTDTADALILKRSLRHFKYQQMIRIIARDLSGTAPVDEILAEWSDIADVILQHAYEISCEWITARYGPSSCSGVFLALGKLGGRELNISSDIDLLFLYGSDAEAPFSNHEYFVKVVSTLTDLLSAQTEDGFVFRVDHELRPEGHQGTLANSIRAAERYYEGFGSDWERQALIRARPVAGDRSLGEQFLKNVEPFVYRRTLAISNLQSMREMKLRMEREAAKSGRKNIKHGVGGIREAEFFVQAHQLLHGGRLPELQTSHTFTALEALASTQIIHASVAGELWNAYAFLRRVENMLQMVYDQQTHEIPVDEEGERALAKRLGLNALRAELAAHQAVISKLFHGLFAEDFERIELERAITANLENCTNDEERIDSLAWFRKQELHRISYLDLTAELPLQQILHRITLVAMIVLNKALELAKEQLEARYGMPRHPDGKAASFTILGFGRIGSDEMDYGSDLDIGFLYSDHGRTDGKIPISSEEFFTKLAQRVVSLLTTRSRYGRAYHVDTDLRPSGRSGALVTPLSFFREYHLHEATAWEHLTLLKARVIAGDTLFGDAVEQLRCELIAEVESDRAADMYAELHRLQLKFRKERSNEGASNVELKFIEGGLADVDLVLRTLQLFSQSNTNILRIRNSFALLKAFEQEGRLQQREAETLSKSLYFYRRLISRIRLVSGISTSSFDFTSANASVIARQMGSGSVTELLHEIRSLRTQVTEVYAQRMCEQ